MILGDFLKALGQIGDRRFRGVLWLGFGLSLALLFGVFVLVVSLAQLFLPDAISLPWVGEVTWIDNAVSLAAIPLMLLLSVFLMVPVASLFTGLFLDRIADAVEARHYPHLPPNPEVPWGETMRDSAAFLGLLIAVNTGVALLALILVPLAPLLFLGANGFLLGREYFQIAAMRRMGRAGAREVFQRHRGQIWLAGVLMTLPLTIPVVNLFVPILGAATFTHLFHRVAGTGRGYTR